MRFRNFILILFVSIFLCGLNQNTSAQIKLSIKDKREVIKLILKNSNFEDALSYVPDGKLFLSTENIPEEIQSNFPKIKGVKFIFITPKEIQESEIRYFNFSSFITKHKFVLVGFNKSFINPKFRISYSDGVNYICRKIRGKWKIRIRGFSIQES